MCGVFISSGSPAWPTLEGNKTYLMAWGREKREFFCFVFFRELFFFRGGTLLVWRIRMGTIWLSDTCQ